MHSTDTATPKKPQQFSFVGPGRVYDSVRGPAHPLTLNGAVLWAALCAALMAAGCGRTSLDQAFGTPITDAAAAVEHPPDLAMDRPVDRPVDRAVDRSPDRAIDRAIDRPIDRPIDRAADRAADHAADHAPPACVPEPEICNGVDDDCNGSIDENLPAIPCPNGGNQYCVAGHYSDCPQRCEVCVPGSARTCFTSFCTYWGTQPCAPDGRSFGPCQEAKSVPPECLAIAQNMQRSAALEQCCLKNGYCCVDTFDLDNDGDRNEMIGNCGAVSCDP
jgi:hypothetical protein